MQTILAFLAAGWTFAKGTPWYVVALPLIFLGGCVGGCSCERARPHVIVREPDAKQHVMTIINGTRREDVKFK